MDTSEFQIVKIQFAKKKNDFLYKLGKSFFKIQINEMM